MKAAVLEKFRKPLVVKDVPEPILTPDSAVVKGGKPVGSVAAIGMLGWETGTGLGFHPRYL